MFLFYYALFGTLLRRRLTPKNPAETAIKKIETEKRRNGETDKKNQRKKQSEQMKQKIFDVLIPYSEFGTLLRRRLTPRPAIGTVGAKAQKMLIHSSNSSKSIFL